MQLYLIHHPKIFNVANQTYFKLNKTTFYKTVNSNNSSKNPRFINTENYPNLEIKKF